MPNWSSSDNDSSSGLSDMPELTTRNEDTDSDLDTDDEEPPPLHRDSSSDGDSASSEPPPLASRVGKRRNGNSSESEDDDDDDDDDDDGESIPELIDRNKSDDSSDDYDSDDGDGPPGLVSRIDHSSSSEEEKDDSSSSSDSDYGFYSRRNFRNNNKNKNNKKNKSKFSKQSNTARQPPQDKKSQNNNKNNKEKEMKSLRAKVKAEEERKKKELQEQREREKEEQRKKQRMAEQMRRNNEKQKRQKELKKKREAEERERKRLQAIKEREQRKKLLEKRKKEEERKRKELERKRKLAFGKVLKFMRIATARRKNQRMRHGLIKLQAVFRGRQARIKNDDITKQLKEFVQFYRVWIPCMEALKTVEMDEPDWAALRDKQAYIRQQELIRDDMDDEDALGRAETDEKLTSAMEDAVKTMEETANARVDDDIEEVEGLPTERNSINNNNNNNSNTSNITSVPLNFKRIHLSGEVVKWLRNGDKKYVDFFIRRMKQLSGGERSRILAKKLRGSTTAKVPIYETYLEQKSGFRILWTEKDDYMLVWYVAKHKSVSRLMRLIDDSKNRSERQRVSIHDINEMKTATTAMDHNNEHNNIFLDPLGNVPLKVYDISTDEIEQIGRENWTPALHLTKEERDVVETPGTVLLLGRSGTGKTICICNRMEFDRQKFFNDQSFSQLFIARSPRLCTYVKKNIGEFRNSEFVTFDRLLEELEKSLPKLDGIRDSFPENQLMRFSTFKREVYNGGKGVDALIVWTNIRSFLKGSIEALQQNTDTADNTSSNFVVSEEEYLSLDKFGKKRCRLPMDQRKIVYEIFLKYQEYLASSGAWDNCDRIISLIQRLLAAKNSHPDLFDSMNHTAWCKWSKIYVDEVQDYTQSEILLFFHLGGAGNLFLAGDPAQNVTKGVEFRFDDIRSVGYHIVASRQNQLHLIPQKPKIVNVNFRSHAGILNVAGEILSRMFEFFPHSAKQLGKDDGLFQGPRPGIFHNAKAETMAALVQKKMHGTVILTHDDNVEECVKKLGGYELVYGIRKAKGLEFKSVIVLDFFSFLSKDLQKPWREMLLDRASTFDFKLNHPEVEGQLKLLYTAVTRCIDRLFFAETSSSLSGKAFVRWMASKSVATENKVGNIENMTMTQDEWLASGITNAEAAEAEVNSDNKHAQSLIEKAIYCFDQANNDSFLKKAKIQLESFIFRLMLFNAVRNRTFSSNENDDEKSSSNKKKKSLEQEKKAVKLMERLLEENLLVEARGLAIDLRHLLKIIYPNTLFFESKIVRVLPGGGYTY